jgi:hypothetical protein
MVSIDSIKEDLRKAIKTINKNPSILDGYGNLSGKKLTPYDFLGLAGNHLFDDHYEKLGLTRLEGRKIRAYFMNRSSDDTYEKELTQEFPEFFDDSEKPQD